MTDEPSPEDMFVLRGVQIGCIVIGCIFGVAFGAIKLLFF